MSRLVRLACGGLSGLWWCGGVVVLDGVRSVLELACRSVWDGVCH